MILCALLLGAAATPRIVELPDAKADSISVQIVLSLPELDARELGTARVLSRVLLSGTSMMTRDRLLLLTSQAGGGIRCTLMPDCLRVSYRVPKGDLGLASQVASALTREATLGQEPVDAALAALPFAQATYWSEAVDPATGRYDRIKRETVVALYRHLFRPLNIVIGVGGAFESGMARKEFDRRFGDWIPEADTYPAYHYVAMPQEALYRRRPITTIDFRGPVSKWPCPDLPVLLTATSALGTGKGSALFQISREDLGLSYRQEAFVRPTRQGLAPHLLIAMSARADEAATAATLRAKLLQAVAGWSEGDLVRAQAMVAAGLDRGDIPTALEFHPGSPIGIGLDDRTALAAYWTLRTGAPLDLAALLTKVRAVGLEEVRAKATEVLQKAEIAIITGR